MSTRCWEKYPSMEASDEGMGANLRDDGPCTCSSWTYRGPSEMEKFEIRVKEIMMWLMHDGNIAKVRNSETDIAGQLCRAAEVGDTTKMNQKLEHLKCTEEINLKIATELLNVASQNGKLDAVQNLVEEWGADVQGESVVGGNAFMCATGAGHIQLVKYFLAWDPSSLDAPCQDGFTPLMFASFWSRVDVLALLQSRGADLTAKDRYGRTALSYAALHGNVDAINCLCKAGSDIYQEDHKGKTPLELARSYNRSPHVVAALTQWENPENLRPELKECSSKKNPSGSVKSRGRELDRQIADQHMEDLLKEIEEEELQRSQRKGRKANNKKKKRGVAKPVAGSSGGSICDDDRYLLNGLIDGASGGTRAHHKVARNDIRGKGGGQGGSFDESCKDSLDVVQKQTSAGVQTPREPSRRDDPGFLREYWGFILQEAAKCWDPEKQLEYLECIPKIMQECKDMGISVKYGKKVLCRLERVAAGREAIQRAIQLGNPSDINDALANAKGLKDMIDAKLWSQAENAAREVQLSQLDVSQHKMAHLQLDQGPAPGKPPEPQQQQYGSHNTSVDGEYAPVGSPQACNDPLCSVDPAQGQFLQTWHGGSAMYPSFDSFGAQLGSWGGAPPAEQLQQQQQPYSPHKLEEGLEKDLECIVCMAAQKGACCIPCGHISMCYPCSLEVQGKTGVCPICRGDIEFVLPLQ